MGGGGGGGHSGRGNKMIRRREHVGRTKSIICSVSQSRASFEHVWRASNCPSLQRKLGYGRALEIFWSQKGSAVLGIIDTGRGLCDGGGREGGKRSRRVNGSLFPRARSTSCCSLNPVQTRVRS